MSPVFLDTINCAKRNALISYYLGKKIAATPTVRTAEDIYDYLLVDPLVHSNVITSQLGEAISSAQQYLNRALKGLEPDIRATPDEVNAWQQQKSRYAVWAGYQQLRAYPENYLDPTLRVGKTTLFTALEMRLNQGRINDDGVQEAVLDYLNQFEEVSNLDVVSGYQDGVRSDKDVIYFIGRSKKAPDSYYWRSLRMDLYADGEIHPNAWDEWKKIEGLTTATRGSVQPMCMNGRLYVLWCEATLQEEPLLKAGETSKPRAYNLSVKLAFKRFDDSWSAPQELHKGVCDELPHRLIAVKDITDPHNTFLRLEVYNANTVALVNKTFDALLNMTLDALSDVTPAPQATDLSKFYNASSIQHPYNKATRSYTFTPQSSFGVGGLAAVAQTMRMTLQLSYVIEGDDLYIVPLLSVPVMFTGFGGLNDATAVEYKVLSGIEGETLTQALTLGGLKKGDYRIKIAFTSERESQKIVHSVKFLFDINKFGAMSAWSILGPMVIALNEGTLEIQQVVDIHYIQATSNSPYLIVDAPGFLQSLVPSDSQGTHTPIRLNTLFVKELVRRGENGIEGVMAAAHVALPGESVSEITSVLDFNGANSLYLWELFFHMPFLVAHRLNQEQRFGEATRWLQYLFDPSRVANPWNGRTLVDVGNAAGFISQALTDPNARAMANPTLYRKAVFFSYVKNLMDQGDACYRELTRDGLAEAKQWYKQALGLLGQPPGETRAPRWSAQTTQTAFDQDSVMRAADTLDSQVHTGIFVLPRNRALQQYWTQLDTRLYNLRHGLNIDGQLLSLPLFDAPSAPFALLASRSASASASGAGAFGTLKVPHYRFAVMLNKANAAADMLIQLGSALHSALERKDSVQLEMLQQDQQYTLLTQFTLGIQEEAIALSRASQAALNVSKEAAQIRVDHYTPLVAQGQSALETEALRMHSAAIIGSAASTALRSVGGFADFAPNVFGLACGGMHYGSPLYAASAAVEMAASALSQSASVMESSEQYRRRLADWTLMRDQAKKEVEQIDKQSDVERRQQRIQEKQLLQLKEQQSQVNATRDFLSTRFSGGALYQWMTGQLSALYFQAYDGVMGLCLATEAAWQYETGVFDGPRFIQPGAWNDRYRGLLAGESLKLGLQRLDQTYLMRNDRKLEIVHTVSLKALLGADWKTDLVKTGTLSFAFTERHFAQRYPGHYLRQIAAVSLTLPALVGPYQDIRAVLLQVSSAFSTHAEMSAVEYLMDPTTSNPSFVQTNLRASQQVALSTGMDDSGAFQLNFGDERYLPFEGTGAISSWQLAFPNPHCDEQRKMLDSLTDIIVRVRYTARVGSPDFARDVQALLDKPQLAAGVPN
ncbi:neuraminidase-like domain-containing protein [Pseudomonas marginalis]|uniref:Tc toxin subunit A-related protein n=1 Tax=Pseudomonas marginalis TaxID=298 RepID=UPI003B9EB8F4